MSQETLTGSCLCGQISYEVTGESKKFYHCHCQRCRKASGTGHASNIMVKSESLVWLSGEDLLRRYNVPDAERFYTHFCNNCGSPMPREIPEIGMKVIPAGSLDTKPSIQPGARIFWDSRSEWSCSGDAITTHSELHNRVQKDVPVARLAKCQT
ncbi:MAG: GFA family protein, partial [Thiohalomonadales bacterium]